VNGQLYGDPDVRLWTLGLHGGYRIAMGATSAVTPYLNVDYTSARLRGFTETGLVGPELTVLRSTEKRTTLTGGVKWAGDIGGVVPEVDLGYRYQFGDRRSNVTNFFLGDEHCAFDIISENEKRGAFLAGLSLGGKAGPVDVRVSYQGLFNGQSTSHAGNFKIVLPFGGHAAPPPPPPEPVVAPPPPPPPPVEVAPPPPPPPPPPAPSGERG
jgi:trimeric autotransporter adhesin